MAPDEETLTRWVREAQAKLALQDLSPSQAAVVASMKAARGHQLGPDRTRLLLEAARQVSLLIQEVLRARDVPATVQNTLRQALAILEGEAEAEDAEGVKATIASLARHQMDQEIHIGLRESQLKAYLARPSPPPRAGEELAEGRRATALVDKEVRPVEDAKTTRRKRWLANELARGTRR